MSADISMERRMLLTAAQSKALPSDEEELQQRIRSIVLSQTSPSGSILDMNLLVATLSTAVMDLAGGITVPDDFEITPKGYQAALDEGRHFYRIKQRGVGFEPQIAMALHSGEIVWLSLLRDGGFAEPEAVTAGPSEKRYPMTTRELAWKAIAKSRVLRQEIGRNGALPEPVA
jgi:hypothetical protein